MRRGRSCATLAAWLDVPRATAMAEAWHHGEHDLEPASRRVLREVEGLQSVPNGDRLTHRGLNASSFRLLGPPLLACAGGLTSFGRGDNKKRFCLADDKRAEMTTASHTERPRRVLFSIGSNNELDFEYASLDAFDAIYVFDCTLPEGNISAGGYCAQHSCDRRQPEKRRQPTPMEKAAFDQLWTKLRFIPVCLGNPAASTTSRRYEGYAELMRLTGEQSGPELLKMDLEGWVRDACVSNELKHTRH